MKRDIVMYAIDRIFKARLSPWHYAARKRIKGLYPLMDERVSWSERECIIEQLVGESGNAGKIKPPKTKRRTIRRNEGWIRKRVGDRIHRAIEKKGGYIPSGMMTPIISTDNLKPYYKSNHSHFSLSSVRKAVDDVFLHPSKRVIYSNEPIRIEFIAPPEKERKGYISCPRCQSSWVVSQTAGRYRQEGVNIAPGCVAPMVSEQVSYRCMECRYDMTDQIILKEGHEVKSCSNCIDLEAQHNRWVCVNRKYPQIIKDTSKGCKGLRTRRIDIPELSDQTGLTNVPRKD